MRKDFDLAGRSVAAIAYCRRQHITNLVIWPSCEVETAAAEMTPAHDNFRIRSNALSGLNTQELAQFEHLIRAGAPI